MGAVASWYSMLVETRTQLGLSQAELAALSSVSLPSIKAYEQGKRHPSRPYLTAMLEAMHCDRSRRNAILAAAGYATDGLELGPWIREGFMFTPAEAAAYIHKLPWPAFVASEFMEVQAANPIAEALWGVDIAAEYPDASSRNIVGFAGNARFVERIANIEEAFGVIASAFKGHPRGPESLDAPSPALKAALDVLRAGDQRFVAAFAAAWATAEPMSHRVRWEYPLDWRDPAFGLMRFCGSVTVASEPDGLVFNDWIPRDAATWDALERLIAAARQNESP